MPQQGTLVVFFNTDRLPPVQEFDLSARETLLQERVEELKEKFPKLQMGSPIGTSCAIPVRASEEVIAELIEYLRENRLGTVVYDGSLIRTA